MDALVAGHGTHEAVITRRGARDLELPVGVPDDEDEELMWTLWTACDAARSRGADGPFGLIAGRGFLARENRTWSDAHDQLDIEWAIEEEPWMRSMS